MQHASWKLLPKLIGKSETRDIADSTKTVLYSLLVHSATLKRVFKRC